VQEDLIGQVILLSRHLHQKSANATWQIILQYIFDLPKMFLALNKGSGLKALWSCIKDIKLRRRKKYVTCGMTACFHNACTESHVA
jgi:hypothetical protein